MVFSNTVSKLFVEEKVAEFILSFMKSGLTTKKVKLPICSEIKGFPESLYVRGVLPESVVGSSLGIVGSRRISSYGVRVLKELFYYLKGTGVTVISGFTVGTDTYAHEFSLESGCPTVAVMPCGCDIISPLINKELYFKILAQGGAVVSEFADGFLPQKWTYPKRNRIVAGLSKVLLVVEASLKSGTMITACFSRRYGRRIFSVPGDIYAERSLGTNKLILEGAEIYLSPVRLIETISAFCRRSNYSEYSEALTTSGDRENAVLRLLKEKSAGLEDISKNLNLDLRELNLILTEMLLKNLIYEKGGNYYIL